MALAIFQKVELISFHPEQGFDSKKNAVRVKEKVNSQWRNKKHKTKVSITTKAPVHYASEPITIIQKMKSQRNCPSKKSLKRCDK